MAEKGSRIRIFVALFPPAAVVENVSKLISELREELHGNPKWVVSGQLHLTLQFLGYYPQEQIPEIEQIIMKGAAKHPSFVLHARSLGCFPNANRPRVLWVGLEGQLESLQRLKTDLDTGLASVGYQAEARPFHPHLTIARTTDLSVQGRKALKDAILTLQEFSGGEFDVTKIDLVQSILAPKGASYKTLGSFALGK
ncbi:MAG: RNA 2',3'-cyclic phosphodiesterase [Limisphaerales bacterium]